ncbi:MAG: sulfatase-like hydrolase/transferase, partial [Phaeodactylibacter sp.]|nr:sulfatase-like hydrolase/transferase [Phaeodactylibacter sp.]
MEKRKKLFRFGALLLIPVVVWLCWPLSSDRFEIQFDQAALEAKLQYLQEPVKDSFQAPNIVVLLADDLGWADISLNGSPYVQTPNIDAFAQRGATCPKAYVTAPVCAPSRAGFITGRYQQRFGFETQMHYRHLRNRLEYLSYSLFVRSDPWTIEPRKKVPRKVDEQMQG